MHIIFVDGLPVRLVVFTWLIIAYSVTFIGPFLVTYRCYSLDIGQGYVLCSSAGIFMISGLHTDGKGAPLQYYCSSRTVESHQPQWSLSDHKKSVVIGMGRQ